MTSALLYLQFCSAKNRLTSRLKRLRQPKYLVLSVIGGLYTWLYFFRFFFAGYYSSQRPSSDIPSDTISTYESAGALMFLLLVLLAWLVPRERAALAFTEAEVAFLFPAPISRRGLVHFKLLRSQAAILFTTLFLTLVFNRFGGRAWIHAAGWWLILSTLNLHLLGSSFMRTMLLDRGITNWQRRVTVLFLLSVLAGITIVWAVRTIPAADLQNLDTFAKAEKYVETVFSSGPLPYLLYPFKLMVRPYLAANAKSFFVVVWPPLLIMVLHYAWVTRMNVAFEEASVEASRKLAERIVAARSGKWHAGVRKPKAGRPPFRLRPEGYPAIALLWKNLIHAGQAFNARLWIVIMMITLGVSFGVQGTGENWGATQMVGTLAFVFLCFSILLGPQFVRQDFRHDLLAADMLKLFPVPAWQIALGELLAPAVILTGIQWFLLILAAGFFPESRRISFGLLTAVSASVAMVLPILNVIFLVIPNAAVLVFPAWFHIGKTGAQGIEATGQRVVAMLSQLVVFIVAIVPAAAVFCVVFFIAGLVLNTVTVILLASLAAAIVLALEAALGVMLLGRLFDRFDLSAELPP